MWFRLEPYISPTAYSHALIYSNALLMKQSLKRMILFVIGLLWSWPILYKTFSCMLIQIGVWRNVIQIFRKKSAKLIYVILYLYNWLNMWTLKEKLLFVCYSVFINDFLVIRIFKILKFINTTLKSIEYFKTWYDKRRIPILFQIIFFLCIFRDKIFLNPKYPSLVPCHASLKR